MATKKKVKLRKPTSDPTAYKPNAGNTDSEADTGVVPAGKQTFCDLPHGRGFDALMKKAKAKKKAMMQKEGYGRKKKAGD